MIYYIIIWIICGLGHIWVYVYFITFCGFVYGILKSTYYGLNAFVRCRRHDRTNAKTIFGHLGIFTEHIHRLIYDYVVYRYIWSSKYSDLYLTKLIMISIYTF